MGHKIIANAFNGLIIGWPSALTFALTASGVNRCHVRHYTSDHIGVSCIFGQSLVTTVHHYTTLPIWQYAHCYSQDDVRIDQVTTALLRPEPVHFYPTLSLLVMDRRRSKEGNLGYVCRWLCKWRTQRRDSNPVVGHLGGSKDIWHVQV